MNTNSKGLFYSLNMLKRSQNSLPAGTFSRRATKHRDETIMLKAVPDAIPTDNAQMVAQHLPILYPFCTISRVPYCAPVKDDRPRRASLVGTSLKNSETKRYSKDKCNESRESLAQCGNLCVCVCVCALSRLCSCLFAVVPH